MTARERMPRIALAILLAVGIAWAWLGRGGFDAAAIEAQMRAMGPWAPVGFVVLYTLATVLFLPGAALGLAGGVLFGPVWGAVWNLLGATLGATLAFLVARYVASEWVARHLGGRLKRVFDGVEAEGWRFVALTRLVPLVPFNLLNYALGLTRIRLGPYVVASLVCMMPGTVAYTWLGHAGREALAGDVSALRYGLLGLGLLAMVAFLPRLVRRLRTPGPTWLDTDDLRRRLESGAAPLIVDVRGPDEFVGPLGHIPGSLNLPLGELPSRLGELAGEGRPIVLVCRTDKRSMQAAAALAAFGVRDVAVLRGGMERWRRG